MTTNAGSDKSANLAGFSNDSRAASAQRTEKALETFLRPEFINRVDSIITFRSLSEDDFTKIVKIMLNELAEVLKEKGIDLTYTEDAAQYIAKNSYSGKFGARNMRRYIQNNVEDKLAELIIADYNRKITKARICIRDKELTVICM